MRSPLIRRAPRQDGTRKASSTAAWVTRLLERPPQLAFDAARSPEDQLRWRRQVRRKLRMLLNIPPSPITCVRKPRLVYSKARKGYTLQRWLLYPEAHLEIPVLMLIPEGVNSQTPAPAVLCIPGSDHPKELLCGEPSPYKTANPTNQREAMALFLVREGFVTLAMDNPATAELFDTECDDWRRHAGLLIWMGRNYEGVTTFQKLAMLDWMRTLPWIDAHRIALCGHSLGAKPALLAGVLNRHVRAVVWNNEASSEHERVLSIKLKPPAPWQIVPGLITWFDYIDLMCALAPTPLLLTEGGMLKDHARIRKAYTLAGAADSLQIGFMPNYSDPRSRRRDPLPRGLDPAGYARYANYDGDHYFKADQAVPWLKRILMSHS